MEQVAQGGGRVITLEVLERSLSMTLGDMAYGDNAVTLTVGLDDLKGLF